MSEPLRWVLELPVRLYSLNQIYRWRYGGRGAWRYHRLRMEYGWAIMAEGAKGVRPAAPNATGPRSVCITRIMGPRARRYDADNLAGGAKPLLDELVKFKLLKDDSEKWCRVEYAQERGREHGVRIELEDFD